MSARRNPDGKMRRGTSNTNSRGSAITRRRRKCWMLAHFGDGVSCACFSCAKTLVYSTLQADRIGFIRAMSGERPMLGDPEGVARAIRLAKRKTHPDIADGSAGAFQRVSLAEAKLREADAL